MSLMRQVKSNGRGVSEIESHVIGPYLPVLFLQFPAHNYCIFLIGCAACWGWWCAAPSSTAIAGSGGGGAERCPIPEP